MAVAEKLEDNKILLTSVTEFSKYDLKEKCNCWVDVNLKAPLFHEDTNSKLRAAIDIVAVIDRSGSMGSGKLDRVKKTLHFILSQLTPRDRLSLIVYDDSVQTLFPLTYIRSEHKSAMEASIDMMNTGSSTNLCDGLLQGMKCIMEREGEKAQVASLLLLTDGQANVGIVDPASIVNAMKNPNAYTINTLDKITKKDDSTSEKITKIDDNFTGTVYTFGFGNDHNAKLLEEISTTGEGVYYFIDTDEKVPHCFADCLGGLLSTVGQNITLSLELSNKATITNITAKNTPKFNTNKTKADISLGDIQSEEQRDVLLELELPSCSGAGDVGIINYGLVTLSYFNVITSRIETAKQELHIERGNSDGKPEQPNLMIDRQRNRIIALRALSDSRDKASDGHYEEGSKILKETKEIILASITAKEPAIESLIKDIDDCINGMVNAVTFASFGYTQGLSAIQTHSTQRCNYNISGMQTRIASYSTPSRTTTIEFARDFDNK